MYTYLVSFVLWFWPAVIAIIFSAGIMCNVYVAFAEFKEFARRTYAYLVIARRTEEMRNVLRDVRVVHSLYPEAARAQLSQSLLLRQRPITEPYIHQVMKTWYQEMRDEGIFATIGSMLEGTIVGAVPSFFVGGIFGSLIGMVADVASGNFLFWTSVLGFTFGSVSAVIAGMICGIVMSIRTAKEPSSWQTMTVANYIAAAIIFLPALPASALFAITRTVITDEELEDIDTAADEAADEAEEFLDQLDELAQLRQATPSSSPQRLILQRMQQGARRRQNA